MMKSLILSHNDDALAPRQTTQRLGILTVPSWAITALLEGEGLLHHCATHSPPRTRILVAIPGFCLGSSFKQRFLAP